MAYFLQTRIVAALLLAMTGAANAQDSAVFDAQRGTWQLNYQDAETEKWISKTYVQQNGIKPTISTSLSWGGQGFTYSYRIKNGREAKQAIDTFRIWGIPAVYAVPALPPITIDAKVDPDGEDRQQWAQLAVKRKFQDATVKAPKGWSAALRVDTTAVQTSFVWTPGLKDTDPDGIAPGKHQAGFDVLRPELPGVARAKLTGSTAEPWGLDNLPSTAFWSQKVDEIQSQDYLLVPVLAPIIEVPKPYDGAELARRVKLHVQSWPKYGHLTQDTLERLNRQFDVLIPALQGANKPTARQAAVEVLKEVFSHHPGLHHEKLGKDDDDKDAEAMTGIAGNLRVGLPVVVIPIDRVAARALAFNIVYLLTRMELGR